MNLIRSLILAPLFFVTLAPIRAEEPAANRSPDPASYPGADSVRLNAGRLKDHVFTLASKEFSGRRGEAADKTVEYLQSHFQNHRLKPGLETGYVQEVIQASSGKRIGRNVLAKVEGSDPELAREWIILSAHWDHLGESKSGERTFHGADDNASGVAMLLESAAWFAQPQNRPKRSILFVAFDLEEYGLFGSRYFAAHMPFEESAVKLFITADMIGRSLSGICREWVFVMGSERLPQSRDWLKSAQQGRQFRAGLLGTDLVGVRSDYGPFMTRQVPYLFFSTGESQVYHTPDDVPETIDYAKLHQVSEIIAHTTKDAANCPKIEGWSSTPVAAPEEMSVIASVLEEMKSPANEIKLGGYQKNLIDKTLDSIKKLVMQKTVTESERRSIIRTAQFLMFTAL